MKFQRLGWIVAAAILGVIAASGFQTGMDKVASVDLTAMLVGSDLGKANDSALQVMQNKRQELLNFIAEKRVLTVEQAKNLRTLWLKDSMTAADTATLDRLKADITASATRNIELSTKANLTPEERTLLQEYATRSATMDQLTGDWAGEFRQEIMQSIQDRRADILGKAKAAAQSVAKLQGYSLVFDTSVAVYAANDLTAEALKAMNAKK